MASIDLATTDALQEALANIIGTAPANLDTLNELAAALGDDENFAAAVTASLAGKLDKADATGVAAALAIVLGG